MAVSSPHRTQYEPHVASAHRFEMFGLERKRLTPDQRRRFPIISEPTHAHHILKFITKHITSSPGINGRGQAQVNGHEGQAEEPKRECNRDEELNEPRGSWGDEVSDDVQRQA